MLEPGLVTKAIEDAFPAKGIPEHLRTTSGKKCLDTLLCEENLLSANWRDISFSDVVRNRSCYIFLDVEQQVEVLPAFLRAFVYSLAQEQGFAWDIFDCLESWLRGGARNEIFPLLSHVQRRVIVQSLQVGAQILSSKMATDEFDDIAEVTALADSWHGD